MTPTRRGKGFTLLEVLVALAIVTIGMAALLSALSSAADSSIYLRDKTFAEWVALNRIEEVRLALQRPTKGKTDGNVEFAGVKWKWEQEVLETEIKGIMRIDVRVKPASIAGDANWYTTMSGITGDALATLGTTTDYYAKPSGLASGGPRGPGTPGPGASPRPGQSPIPGGTPNPGGPGGTGGGPGDDSGGQDDSGSDPPPVDRPSR